MPKKYPTVRPGQVWQVKANASSAVRVTVEETDERYALIRGFVRRRILIHGLQTRYTLIADAPAPHTTGPVTDDRTDPTPNDTEPTA